MDTDQIEFPPFDVYNADCPTRQVLTLISARWTILVVGALAQRPHRFGELRKLVGGISPKSLTKTLRDLENDGMVTREVFAEVPPRTEYALTDFGRTLIEPLAMLRNWSEANIEQILEARERSTAE